MATRLGGLPCHLFLRSVRIWIGEISMRHSNDTIIGILPLGLVLWIIFCAALTVFIVA